MQDLKTYFKGKKITVMGLGLLGRGVGDAKFLAEHGAEIIVTDLKSEEELAHSVEQLKEFSNITFVLGEHRKEDFQNRDYILKAAGVPLDSPFIEEAKKNNIPVKMSASWFQELTDIPVVGVTGTRGKSTVTHMLHAVLEAAGKQVLLGGNVRGVSTLALLDTVSQDSIALFELDSWQLQGFGDAKISPNVAVFTTFFDDHLNYYKNDTKQYLHDKAQIFLHQKSGDTLVLGEQAKDIVLGAYQPPVKPIIVSAALIDGWDVKMPGKHNRYNVACAVAAARSLGISDEISKKAIANFSGVPGRLELIREINGVKFYNDTTATTPEATIAALRAFDNGEKRIVLIMGGGDKGLSMDPLLKEIEKTCKATVLLAGTGTDKVAEVYQLEKGTAPYTDLQLAVEAARDVAEPGDVVLLSPAFASFGLFKNEFDRGDQFNGIVERL